MLPKDSAALPQLSACVVLALSEAPAGGLPNGYLWLPGSNVTNRIAGALAKNNFTSTKFCLVVSGQGISGRTVSVGGAGTVCGNAAQLKSAIGRLQDRHNLYDMATAISTQLSNGNTCAGQDDHITIVIAVAPLDVVQPDSGQTQLLEALSAKSASMFVFGNLNTDSLVADDWVLALVSDGTGYEAVIDTQGFKLVNDATSGAEDDMQFYENVAYQSGGGVLDANWLGDFEYQPIIENVLVHLVQATADQLRRSSCQRCTCRPSGLQCSTNVHVAQEGTCRFYLGEC